MSVEQKITNDIKVPNNDLETLRIHFSHCFDKNGNFDFEKFRQNLGGNEISFSNESYGLDWLGKSYARLLASDPATTLLKADETHNAKSENAHSENLLIKGDNLEVLKHLSNAYHEKIKMIYIDPPYNTGSDGFVYEDDRKFTVKELQNLAGVSEEKAQRILDFTQQKSNSHSAWLTFMYPRLYIARRLLKDDGVIFVSIDDNEVAQLRLLMDEVFGEENFVSEFIWEKKKKPSFLHRNVGKLSEYIVCYLKNNTRTFPFSLENTTKGKKYPINNSGNSLCELIFPPNSVRINLPDSIIEPQDMSENNIITFLKTRLKIENNYNQNEFVLGGEFRYSQETINEIIKNGEEIVISKIPFRPNHIKDGGEIKKMKNIFSPNHYDMETNEDATEQLDVIFGKEVFTNPKPIKLISTIIRSVTYNDENSIVLDFFAGSGTTGDAVMQLNAEDGGNRRYILVQLPEIIDSKRNKVAYDFVKNELKVDEPTIFEITKERLIRAAKKIKDETISSKIADKEQGIKEIEGKLDLDNKTQNIKNLKAEIKALKEQDLGFRIFETTPIWEDYGFEADEFDNEIELFDESKLSTDDLKALLTTWKTYDGIPLTQDLETVDLGGYIAYYGKKKLYLMGKGFTTDNLKTLLEKIDSDKKFEPNSIIAFGYHFDSKNLRELSENVKSYSNKKNTDIDFIIRY
ncbi:MAG: site-specific DNA-methyltransferase [Victivallaceae bacterium]|nr:site-specific DNA-methyltransferase [Victivallaceae bacterium]